jgi:transposase-like protein
MNPMPWPVKNLIHVRLEFVNLALQPGTNVRQLCRRFGISPTVGYKWLDRYRSDRAHAEWAKRVGLLG